MPKQVDHQARREAIAHALWRVVDEQGWSKATMREVAREAGVSLGQLQHYFSSRAEMLAFGVECAAEETTRRIGEQLEELSQPPHPRDALRVILGEMLPLHPGARATSRMHAAYVLEAMHDAALAEQVGQGMRAGRGMVEQLIRDAVYERHIRADCDAAIETDLVLALTGLAPLLELNVIEPSEALAAIEQHLERLFDQSS